MTKANEVVKRICEWVNKNGLHTAPKKTETVVFRNKRQCGVIQFDVMWMTIISKNNYVYLRVTLNEQMTFASHKSNHKSGNNNNRPHQTDALHRRAKDRQEKSYDECRKLYSPLRDPHMGICFADKKIYGHNEGCAKDDGSKSGQREQDRI